MAHTSTGIPVSDQIIVDMDGAEITDPSANQVFRLNYLKELSWKIDIQQNKFDKLKGFIDKAAEFENAIAEIRSDPEDNGITRAERHEIHDLKQDLHHVEGRIDAMPGTDTMAHRILDMEMDFIIKSDEWDLRI